MMRELDGHCEIRSAHNLEIDLVITGAVAGTIFNLSNNLCWHSLDAIWIFSFDKWIGARAALGATYCWNAVDAKK